MTKCFACSLLLLEYHKLSVKRNERADSTKKEWNSLICMSWSKETEKQLNDVVYSKIGAKTEHQSVQINRQTVELGQHDLKTFALPRLLYIQDTMGSTEKIRSLFENS